MLRRVNIARWLPLLAGALLLGGCASPTSPAIGSLIVQLTDAPFPFDSVARADIFIVRVDGRLAATDSAEAETAGDPGGNTDPSQGFITIATPNTRYNLLDLRNGTTVNLGQTTLPTGAYWGFRLILNTDSSSVTLKDGTVLNGNSRPGIKWPSAGQTGIKIVLDQPVNVVAGGTVMVLDFDLGSSFVLRGRTISQNGLLFKPVVHAIAQDITGSLSGSVRADSAAGAPVANATVEVLKAGTALTDTASANIIRSGTSDSTGAFTLSFILPGSYALRAWPPSALSASYDPVLIPTVTVTSGVDAGGNVLVLPHK